MRERLSVLLVLALLFSLSPISADTKHDIRGQDPYVTWHSTADPYTKIEWSARNPIPHGDTVKLTISSVDSKHSIKQFKIGDNVLVKRNDNEVRLQNGKKHPITWYYKDGTEYAEVSLQATQNLTIRSYSAKRTEVPELQTTMPDPKRTIFKAYIMGLNGKLFAPNAKVSYQDAITALVKIFMQPSEQTLSAYVGSGNYQNKYVSYAEKHLDILPHSRIDISDTITRSEFVALLLSMMGTSTSSTRDMWYIDIPRSHWANAYISTAVENSILKVFGENDKFRPNDAITRAEMVAMINRASSRPLYKNGLENHFEDLSPLQWYYQDVLSAVNDMVE